MKKIALIYQHGFGHTNIIVEIIKKGIDSVEGITADLHPADKINDVAQLNDYDGMIFGSPTCRGNVGRIFKDFMNTTSSLQSQQKWRNKIAAGFTDSHRLSGDKLNTLFTLYVFASSHSMIWIGQDHLCSLSENSSYHSEQVNKLGDYLGLMLKANCDQLAAMQLRKDYEIAYCFGQKFARVTQAFNFEIMSLNDLG